MVELARFDEGTSEGGSSVVRGVPAVRVGDQLVTTVLDLVLAQYAVGREGLPGDWPADYDDPLPCTPAWQEAISSADRHLAVKVAREFARNAEVTQGRSMIAMGAGTTVYGGPVPNATSTGARCHRRALRRSSGKTRNRRACFPCQGLAGLVPKRSSRPRGWLVAGSLDTSSHDGADTWGMSRSGSRLSVGGRRYRLPVFLLMGVLVVLTVGFVGESPETTGGRILSAALMVSGFALLTLTTAVIASLFVREEEKPLEQTERAFEAVILARLDELATRLDAIDRALPEHSTGPPDAP